MPLKEGLKEAFDWYIHNTEAVNKKSYIDYIDNNF